ncbi:MAG TPA: DUF3347 domain-containing protein [Ignavibacteria bacterium]|nr:DUF3347 domain-containing protein [Ignavibacteria bacterium]HMR40713.1 DUF3347 domain-containing protein [Ignavibacteria bacterium]
MTNLKNPPKLLILTAIIFTILIGNKIASSQTKVTSQKNYKHITYDNSKLASDYEKIHVTDVFVDYMLLKNSLAKENMDDAILTTTTMIDVIADYRQYMSPDYLKDQKKFSKELSELRAKVNPTITLDEARKIFSSLNDHFMEYIKSYGLYNKTIYVLKCDDNKAYGNGYWMTDIKDDKRNPYSGENAIPECYKVKESWIFK